MALRDDEGQSAELPPRETGAGDLGFLDGSETGSLLQTLDWSRSPLGPPQAWPASLRSVVSLLLQSKFPMFVLWGSSHACIYNDSYVPFLGRRHPQALGRPFQETWPEIWQDIAPLIQRALAGEASFFDSLPLLVERNLYPEEAWFTFSYSPVRDETGEIRGMFCAAVETTGKVVAERALRRSEAEVAGVLEGMTEGFLLLDGEFRVIRVNTETRRLDGRQEAALIGRTFWELWPGTEDAEVGKLCRQAVRDKQPVSLEYPYTPPNGKQVWLEMRGYPSDHGLALFIRDVTERRQILERLKESEDHYRHVVELNPQVVWTARPDGQLDDVSERWSVWTGTSGLGSSWMAAMHPDDSERATRVWQDSVTTGRVFDAEHRIRLRNGSYQWVHTRAFPRRAADGRIAKWYGTTEDVHEHKIAEAGLAESEARLRAVTNSIDQMIWSTLPDGYHDYYNARWYEFTGVEEGSTDGEGWAGLFHADDQERAWTRWSRSLETGEPYEIEYRLRHRSGRYRWVLGRAQPVRDESGRIIRWYGTCTDVHDQKTAEEALRDSRDRLASESRALEVLNRTGAMVAAELGLESLVQRVVDAGVELTGAEYGAFFDTVPQSNAAGERGGGMMLFALSGADRHAVDELGMPRATAMFAPAFRGDGIIRSDDITTDERYGRNPPHSGLADGQLPIRSYLAVPVTSRMGEVIGGLFFGHAEPGRFNERAEQIVAGLSAQAAIGIDNARLFEAVQQSNAELEHRVLERTAELERAHEALRQAQKMEAVGQLTGGIAHDFNNMLAIVIGSLELLARRLPGEDAQMRRHLESAMEGARRAATLTQRLLAFSRQQPLAPEPVEANKLVSGMSDLLRRTLSGDIRLETVLAGGLWRVHADPNQLENAILNLAVNARDAMPEGGRLTIETQNAHLDERYAAQQLGLAAGQYMLIAITDTGSGMSPEVIGKAFDPFFTTKEVGKGTGLGLSQVYGFVKQSGGHVRIYSEPDQGTTVKIYLPRYTAEPADGGSKALDAPRRPTGEPSELVLVVEDEEGVRRFSVEALQELGYDVLEADSAAAALRLLDQYPGVSLLFTDVVMPDVNGRKLAEEATRRRPGLKVLFTTGYTRNAVVHNGVLDAGVQLLGKPFTLDELAHKVRSMLDDEAVRGGVGAPG